MKKGGLDRPLKFRPLIEGAAVEMMARMIMARRIVTRKIMTRKSIYLIIISLCIITGCVEGAGGSKIYPDERGVPIVDYGFVSPKGESSPAEKVGYVYIGTQRNPLTVSTQGMTYYHQYLAGNNSAGELFLNCADWLVDNAALEYGVAVWEYDYPWPTYNNTPPFLSGMLQASAAKTLATAYSLTGQEKYIKTAKCGLIPFFLDVENGGVTHKDAEGWWYEEYAQPDMKVEPRVLNGHMSALMDLYEYYNLTGDEQAKDLFDRGIGDLKARLPDYDTGNGSLYDSAGNIAAQKYQKIHIKQLDKIYRITGDPYFRLYRDRWAYYALAALQDNLAISDRYIAMLRTYQAELNQNISSIEALISEDGTDVQL